MPRILDYYGAREADCERISNLISQATGLAFDHRENSFIGAYYKATGAERGQEVVVLSNELEDEDGISLRWPEWAHYKTIVNSMDKRVRDGGATESPSAFIDDLRDKLGTVADLTFLRRYRASRIAGSGQPVDPGAERPPGTRAR